MRLPIVRTLGYLAYLIAFVLLADYVLFWRPFVGDLRDLHADALPVQPYVSAETMRRLGALRGDRASSFANFAPDKPAGVVRLCAFGDSFTYGDEVADGHDYPALLQRVFHEAGVTNVEVLNFGNSWYGFHQAYVIWRDVGRGFDCDVVLLGPDCFQPERDTTFNHTGLAYPYYLHARYVLDDGSEDGVRLIEVAGSSPAERFEAYFRFVPYLRYARFDRSPPAAIRAVLPRGRTVENPFYYDARDAQAEAYATYERLLARMAESGPPVLLVHSRMDVVAVAERAASRGTGDALAAIHVGRTQRYPYSAPGGHYSAFGNRLLAEQYHALLTGRRGLRTLEFIDADTPTDDGPPGERQAAGSALSSYTRLAVHLGEHRAGFFAVASADPARRGGSAGDLYGSSAAALVGVRSPGVALVDAAFLPVTRALAGGADIELRVGDGVRVRALVSTTSRPVAAGGNLAVVDIAGVGFDGDLVVELGAVHAEAAVDDGEEVVLSVAGEVVATGVARNGSVALRPVAGELRSLRAGEGDFAEIRGDALADTLDLVLERDDGTRERTPIARVRLHEEAAPTTSRAPLIVIDGMRARVRERPARAEQRAP